MPSVGFILSTPKRTIATNLVRPSKGGGRRIAFYGCSRAGKIVSVTLAEHIPDHRRYPLHANVDCPACGNNHKANFAWRALNPNEEGRCGDLIL